MTMLRLVFDCHLDISLNAMEFNRDQRWTQEKIRRCELTDRFITPAAERHRSRNTVCFPELRRGRFGIIVATQIARYSPRFHNLPGWRSPEQAWAHTQGQLDRAIALMEAAGTLCGGRYLLLFDHDLDLALEGDAGLWHDEQKNVFKTLAQWLLERGSTGDAKKAFQATLIARRFDQYDPSCCEMAIIAARQLGNEELARRYEEKLRRMR